MSALLQRGIAEFKVGNKEEARKLFISFVKENPQSERGWEWMYHVSRNNRERIYGLEQVLRINPGNQKAKQLLDGLAVKNSKRISKTNLLTSGVIAGFFILVVCFVAAIVATQLVSHKNSVSYDPPQKVTQPDSASLVVASTISPALPTMTFTPTVTSMPGSTAVASRTATSVNLPIFRSSYESLPADSWRKWPIIPELSAHAQQILFQAVQNPNLDSHTFVKVGDCQMSAGIFLAGYVDGNYKTPEGYEQTVTWFSKSMVTDNITAVNGFGINTVLDPAFGLPRGHDQCAANETPLNCELRTRRPAVVLIGMGTNWVPHGEASFERHLREVVDTILKTGALPILATKADNVEGDWKLNQVIAQVAYDNDLPLVNVWLSVQDLPNHGLELPPRQVYLTGDGWMKRNYAWLVTLEHVRAALAQYSLMH